MIVEHGGRRPRIHPEATLCPGCLVSGEVEIAAETVVLAGAVITSQGAPVRIGRSCVVMENAVIRGAGRHPCTIGDHVLIGPQAHLSGATVEDGCFIATGSAVFNGAVLGQGTTLAIHSVAHVASRCPPDTFVPIGRVAFGDPARIFAPEEVPELHAQLCELGFTRTVFGFDSAHLSNAEATRELCRRYARALRRHRRDRAIPLEPDGSWSTEG